MISRSVTTHRWLVLCSPSGHGAPRRRRPLPIDGVYAAGRFTVEVQGLPPLATMAVVLLPGMRLSRINAPTSTLTHVENDQAETTSRNVVHIRWTGAPVPLVQGFTYNALTPLSDAVLDLRDAYSIDGLDCVTQVSENRTVEGGSGVLVEFQR